MKVSLFGATGMVEGKPMGAIGAELWCDVSNVPDVVDQDVQPAHLLEQTRDLLRYGVIDLNGDAAASARGHDLRGLVDRLGAVLHAGATGNAAARRPSRPPRRSTWYPS